MMNLSSPLLSLCYPLLRWKQVCQIIVVFGVLHGQCAWNIQACHDCTVHGQWWDSSKSKQFWSCLRCRCRCIGGVWWCGQMYEWNLVTLQLWSCFYWVSQASHQIAGGSPSPGALRLTCVDLDASKVRQVTVWQCPKLGGFVLVKAKLCFSCFSKPTASYMHPICIRHCAGGCMVPIGWSTTIFGWRRRISLAWRCQSSQAPVEI